MSEDLPKQELLIKLLKMSTSPNDGEALIAVRKANDLLKSAGWDWEKLIHGKIKVIEDPFKSTATPLNNSRGYTKAAPPPPPRPAARPATPTTPYPPGSPPPPPPPPPKPRRPAINSTMANLYAGWCYCCGDAVLQKSGFIFDPSKHNNRAKSKWQVVCIKCNSEPFPNISPTAMPRQRPLGNVAPSLNDI